MQIRGWMFACTEVLVVIGPFLVIVSYTVLRCKDYMRIYVYIHDISHWTLGLASILLLAILEAVLFLDLIASSVLHSAAMYMTCLTMKSWLQKIWLVQKVLIPHM